MFRIAIGLNVLLVFLVGCRGRGIPPAVAITEFPKELPAPVSVRVQPTEVAAPPDPLSLIRTRLAQIGSEDLLVVRARVDESRATERVVPQELSWGPFPHIVTTVELSVLDTYCGSPTKKVAASYVGGLLPDGRVEYNEFMARHLTVGEQHVYFLRNVRGEYFVELGRSDMLRKDVNDRFTDAGGHPIALEALKELCP